MKSMLGTEASEIHKRSCFVLKQARDEKKINKQRKKKNQVEYLKKYLVRFSFGFISLKPKILN
jgi:hypothetical protein